jgi:hypothetical protein
MASSTETTHRPSAFQTVTSCAPTVKPVIAIPSRLDDSG